MRAILFACIFSLSPNNIFLEKPKLVTDHKLHDLVQNWQTGFGWNFWSIFRFSCFYQGAQHGGAMMLQCCGIPIRSYNFQYVENIKKYWNTPKGNYYFITPLIYTNSLAQSITVENLVDLIKNKRTIFYTGAGISAGCVPTMKELEQSLTISKTVDFFKKIFLHPQYITTAFQTFCKAAIYGKPTPAHYALHDLAQRVGGCILTENVDLLQQRAGSLPIFTHGTELKNVKCEDLDDIEVIVCIGLSRDDCGFLSWYKANNYHGVIVAINKEMPNYLAKEDYFIPGDLQEVLPSLADKLCDTNR